MFFDGFDPAHTRNPTTNTNKRHHYQAKTLEILKGYIVHELLTPAKIDQYITPSEWSVPSGFGLTD